MIGAVATTVLAVDEDKVTPGLLGFLIVVAMAAALYFLLRSMAKHLRRIDVDGSDEDGTDPTPHTRPAQPDPPEPR